MTSDFDSLLATLSDPSSHIGPDVDRLRRGVWMNAPRIHVRRRESVTMFALEGLTSTDQVRWSEGVTAGVQYINVGASPWITSIAVLDSSTQHSKDFVEAAVGATAWSAADGLAKFVSSDIVVELGEDEVDGLRAAWPALVRQILIEASEIPEAQVTSATLHNIISEWSSLISWQATRGALLTRSPSAENPDFNSAAAVAKIEWEMENEEFVAGLIGRELGETEYWPILRLERFADGTLDVALVRLPAVGVAAHAVVKLAPNFHVILDRDEDGGTYTSRHRAQETGLDIAEIRPTVELFRD